ncbi:DUF3488 and transglutaminase-like domain-containing protein [Salinibacterium sp. ZJ454]|uniref:transglutaminase family protein n=1 Tax=Salinibacterium sp. ZJ454 TaxID=2708339 RepID=UPI001420966D|nr:DUF3488 and transglutaminase-like domain-containing protein [Salinibacterium sp. ZJ454]
MASSESRGRRNNWPMTAALALALTVAVTGLSSALEGWDWWLLAVFTAFVALGVAGWVRGLTRFRVIPPLAALAAVLVLLTLRFAADTAIFWVIPTFDSVDRFGELTLAGQLGIAQSIVPAAATEGMLFIIALGIGVVAVTLDTVALPLRSPALSGIPLLVVVAIPSVVQRELSSVFTFVFTASAWLLVLWVDRRRPQPGSAVTVGAFVVVGALIAAPVLAGLQPDSSGTRAAAGLQVGVNPMVNLGNDLRRADPFVALTYTTSRESGHYLRMVTLDQFDGLQWEPTGVVVDRDNTMDRIAEPPGLSDAVVRESVTTDVEVGSTVGRWLPVPYPPVEVDGLVGDWFWEPDGLSIRADNTYIRWQEYTVESAWLRPTAEQLRAVGQRVPEPVQQYTHLPVDVADNIRAATDEVTGGLSTAYEKAIALQDYFRNGDFDYSEDAPVEDGYDGDGLAVISKFLEVRKGYCVHFASSMAVMARLAGIPARVAVGFLPGVVETDEQTREDYYLVTSHDMHAWPELFFEGVGWVPFEPTPGRGVLPNYEAPVVDDPATPNVDESRPVPASTGAPAPTVRDGDLPSERPGPDGADEVDWAPVLWTIGITAASLLVVFAPASWRRFIRSRRLLSHSPEQFWHELRDTATDFGIPAPDTETARAFATRLEEIGEVRGEQLDRLRDAVELHSYAEHAGALLVREIAVGPADAREVIARIESGHGLLQRLRALLLPLSLIPRRTDESRSI